MSVTHPWSGSVRSNCRARTLGAMGNGCRDPKPAAAPGGQPAHPHEPRHALAPRPAPALPQLRVDPGAPVALPSLRVDRGDLETQPFVRPRARRRRARLPRVEARARHLERAAEHPHREDGLLRGDEPESHGCSFAKKAVAFFRMSRSIRSVRFSRRSRPSSSRSSVVSAPGVPRPASISACRTQLRSAVSVRSRSRATVRTDLPLSRTSRTASALNSFVNARRFRLAMTHSYRTFVRSEVSTKSGQVQYPLDSQSGLGSTRNDVVTLAARREIPDEGFEEP